ncbi:TRAP transporter small permease subunit [Albimonas sp. CAU 1670]|uniref:TRAP transporter small permease n=1 Tax=Albimonas sp. CAU 1670 TaxID=3032599 RepID=UPI0023D9F8E8|nr:TRAP transporter small permease subunit [Albimonas sp. CAU 1670]MDF2235243.1 TRAP transporter small permease subunit [Albimonas sp. CAU 1670]
MAGPATGEGGGPPSPSLHRWLERLCLAFAGVGGVTIFAVSLAVTVSVILRTVGVGGIRGDFEMVELACAACAALFLPLCQLKKGHVMVDIFTAWAPERTVRRIDGLWTLLFAAAWAALAWRLWDGMETMRDYGDRTMLLRAPVWWVYAPGVAGMALAAAVALESGLRQLAGVADDDRGAAPR